MAWCRQAASHYLSQCWPRSLSPHDITRPQRVNVYYQIILNFCTYGDSSAVLMLWLLQNVAVATSWHWFRQWFCANRQQAIMCANVDPDHMVSLDCSELKVNHHRKIIHYWEPGLRINPLTVGNLGIVIRFWSALWLMMAWCHRTSILNAHWFWRRPVLKKL